MASSPRSVQRLLSRLATSLRNTPLARWRLLNAAYARFALFVHASRPVRVGPFRIHVDLRDRVLAKKLILYGEYDRHEISLLSSLCAPGDCVMDVGANIGVYTLHLSRCVGPQGCVFAVEPDPTNLRLLHANVEENDCTNVTIMPYALGDREDWVKLYQSPSNRGELRLAPGEGLVDYVNVPMRKGEALLADHRRRPRVVKMDVEGAEPLVLKGLGYTPEILLLEYSPRHLAALGFSPEKFLQDLDGHGYSLEVIHPDLGNRIPVDLSSTGDILPVTYRDFANILAVLRTPS